MDYELIRAKRKTLAVHIDNTGKIIIKAPMYLSLDKIRAFLIEKNNWIVKNQLRIQNLYNKYKNLYDYTEIMYKGRILRCCFDDVSKISIYNERVLIPKKYQPLEKLNSLKNALKRFLQSEAERVFTQKLNDFKSLGFNFISLKIIHSKSKWGSCDSQGNIGLNFRAIMLPESIIDYLIIHELAHTVQLNHSKEFWKIVQAIIPSYKSLRKELKKYNFLQELFR
ncbi:MAG TPA: SprT family zinc-dependent metalloprotease [Clostridia bacterium]